METKNPNGQDQNHENTGPAVAAAAVVPTVTMLVSYARLFLLTRSLYTCSLEFICVIIQFANSCANFFYARFSFYWPNSHDIVAANVNLITFLEVLIFFCRFLAMYRTPHTHTPNSLPPSLLLTSRIIEVKI